MVKSHPNKDINDAIEYAIEKKWRVEIASAHSHAWGKM